MDFVFITSLVCAEKIDHIFLSSGRNKCSKRKKKLWILDLKLVFFCFLFFFPSLFFFWSFSPKFPCTRACVLVNLIFVNLISLTGCLRYLVSGWSSGNDECLLFRPRFTAENRVHPFVLSPTHSELVHSDLANLSKQKATLSTLNLSDPRFERGAVMATHNYSFFSSTSLVLAAMNNNRRHPLLDTALLSSYHFRLYPMRWDIVREIWQLLCSFYGMICWCRANVWLFFSFTYVYVFIKPYDLTHTRDLLENPIVGLVLLISLLS